MLAKKRLLKEIDSLPEEFAGEVLDFVNYIKGKIQREKLEATLLSESSLRKDWLSPEEDEAWQNL